MSNYNNITLDKRKINIFLDSTLLKLGLNNANLGTRYFKELIKLAYYNNTFDIKYKDLCVLLAKELNLSIRKIDSNIYSAINSMNSNLTKKNFRDIFHIEFDYFYISPKKLIILFLNILTNYK